MATEEFEFDLEDLPTEENIEEFLRLQEAQKAEEAKQAKQQKAKTVRQRQARRTAAILQEENVSDVDAKLLKFFRGREKKPNQYFYTPEGNYEIRGAKDVPDTVIPNQRQFVPLKPEELEEALQERLTKLIEKEKAYEIAVNALRSAISEYAAGEASAEMVVLANKAVKEASLARTLVAYPERWINTHSGIAVQDVLMQYDPFEKRKFRYPIHFMKHHELSTWGTYKERIAEQVTSGGAQEEIHIRFLTDVEDPNNGHFHPFTLRNFRFNETEYSSPYQAYQAERMKELGKEDLRKQLLATRSGRTMHAIAIKEKGLPAMPQKLWEDILFQFFHQNKDFAKELNATSTDKFHVMDKQIPPEYAYALEKTRIALRELGDKEVDHQEANEKSITEEEQKKAKVGAIIHNFKRRF